LEALVDGIEFEALRSLVEYERGRPLPRRTLYYWLNRCCIQKDESGLYDSQDLLILLDLARWMKSNRSMNVFIEMMKKKIKQGAYYAGKYREDWRG
jgi:hypothetical protein